MRCSAISLSARIRSARLPETHRYLKELRSSIDQRYKGRSSGRSESVAQRCIRTSVTARNSIWPPFPLMPRLFMGYEVRSPDDLDMFKHTLDIPPPSVVLFLRTTTN